MAFFKNKTINRVYIHVALQGIAFHGGETFAFVYLLKAGLSVPAVLLCIGAVYGSRMLIRYAVVPVVKRIGLRNGLIFGIVLEALTFPILGQVTAAGPTLFLYLLLLAISSCFYWTILHAFIALSGDAEHRGTQVSASEFIGTIVGIVAPAVSGFLLSQFHPMVAFSFVGICMLLSALPFIGAANPRIADTALVPQAARREARLIMLTDGLRAALFHYTWILILFITLKSSFAAFGGALASAGLIGAVFGLFIGKSIDLGKGKRARQIGYAAMGVAGLARALGYPYVWSAVTANALAVVAWPMYATALNSRLYDLAKQSPCPLRYHVVAEGGWDAGTAAGCLIAAGLIAAGTGYALPLVFSLVCTALGYVVLESSFRKR